MITKNDKNEWKYILKGAFVILIYFLFSFFQTLPFDLLNINTQNLPTLAKVIYTLSVELLMIAIIFYTFEKEYQKAFQDIKKNHNKYFNQNLKYYIIGLILMMAANISINLLGGGMSNNETAIRNEFTVLPIYTFISAVILAPPLEESIFRLGFRAIFKNDFLFITISSLIFGSLHLITNPLNELFPLYLLSYSSCGIAFAYMLKKTNNILVPTFFHFMHNGLILTLQTFIFIFS